MQRICEQLLRNLLHPNGSRFELVYFLSSAHGIPVDQACWAAADNALLFWDQNSYTAVELAAAVESRLAQNSIAQRVTLVHTRQAALHKLGLRRGGLRIVEPPEWHPQDEGMNLSAPVSGVLERAEHWEATIARAGSWSRIASQLTGALDRLPVGSLTRRAS